MMFRVLLLLAAPLMLGGAGPAPGLERPVLSPARDAVVGYHLAPATGEAIDVRVSFGAGGKAMRLDLPDQTFMVATPPDKQLVLVVPLDGVAMELPWADGPQPLFLLDERMRFTRKGDATVAGQRCTVWDTVLDRARGTVCISGDGVLLRSQGQDAQGRRSLIEAFSVRFQALVESDFAVPAEFERLAAVPKGRP